jgi:hypothetical protein
MGASSKISLCITGDGYVDFLTPSISVVALGSP